MSSNTAIIGNSITVDVEDYYHVSAFGDVLKPTDWSSMASRVERNTRAILDLFEEADIRGTFFVLGWVAERYPHLVVEIDKRGHEVASHGYSHQLVYNQERSVFESETRKSKEILEDLTGKPVLGYRAASYSITNKSLWALDVLYELGFAYDSSIFPVHHDRYGISDSPTEPYIIEAPSGGTLIEFPLSTASFASYRLPIAGGGYFRLFPYWFFSWCLKRINRAGRPFIFYLHPWEIDPDQPRIEASALSTFRHYNNLDVCEQRLRRLVKEFRFQTVSSTLEELGFKIAAAI